MRIVKEIDFGGGTPVGTPVDIDVIDGVVPIEVVHDCDDCEAVSYLPNILCDGETDWCCDIPSEPGTDGHSCGNLKYCQPVQPNQCLHFQFMIQNTRNAPNAISWNQFISGTQGITYGWYHSSINPTNWTIRMRIFGADGIQVNDAISEALISNASVYLKRDEVASTGFPFQAWYKWHQQIEFCMPAQGAGVPDEFYIEFEVRPFGWSTGDGVKYRSERYCYAECLVCDEIICVDGQYPDIDCVGLNYLNVPDSLSWQKYKGTETPPQLLWSNSLYNGRKSQYKNLVCLNASFRLSDGVIEREIPDRECTPVRVTSWRTYVLYGNEPVPPYVAEMLLSAFSAPVTIIDGIQVNASGIRRNSGVGDMYMIDESMTGCPCTQDSGCF
jgi:hypothetical protein